MSLVRSVYNTWTDVPMDSVITEVFLKLEKITCLINEGDGGNDLVEVKRGKANANIEFDFKANEVKLEAVADLLTHDKSSDDELFTSI